MSQSSSSSTSKLCFNSQCSNSWPEPPRKGWRLRSGEFARLCDRCAAVYEEGKYCDTYHLNASGWRCCESCGKRVHCGCIVSATSVILLDHGGIECVSCARKNVAMGPNHAWSPSLFYNAPFTERLKDLPVKSWNHLAETGPLPWRQAPSLFGSSTSSDFHPMLPNAVEISTGIDRLHTSETLPTSTDKKKIESLTEKLIKGSMKPSSTETPENGNADSPQNGKESAGETQTCNGKPSVDGKGRNQVLPRYWPRVTDQKIQQKAGRSNSTIKPLFEKMLTASDAGKMGRLILPKKCAEAYFPPISRPDGLPLEVQDTEGKEWKLQFRYWPNNNSRMYVLEGVTPCIQNMHLQAGDIVTFSRLEPEGKLLMGFRKASTAPSFKQDNKSRKADKGVPTHGDVDLTDPDLCSRDGKPGSIAKEALTSGTSVTRKRKNSILGAKSKRLKIETEELMELNLTFEEAKGLLRPPPNYIPTVVVIEGFEFEEYEDAPVIGKPTIFATDTAREKVQWVQCEDCQKWRKLPADALLPSKWTCPCNTWDTERYGASYVNNACAIYPFKCGAYVGALQVNQYIVNFRIFSAVRSSCKAAQEVTAEQLEDLLCRSNSVASKNLNAAEPVSENAEALEGLVNLAKSAILGESESCPTSSKAMPIQPRHKHGCSCIICVQPPSGKVPKHNQSCPCNECLKHRFYTLASQREKEQAEKAAEIRDSEQHQHPVLHEKFRDDRLHSSSDANTFPNQQMNRFNEGFDNDSKVNFLTSPPRGHIDLNIKPEQEEEFSPRPSGTANIVKMLQDTQRCYTQQRLLEDKTSENDQADPVGSLSVKNFTNGVDIGGSNQDAREHAECQILDRLASAGQ